MSNSRITVHLARQFLEKQIDLSGYSECDSEAASILATYQDGLDLNGLIHLDDATAEALSTHVGWLCLCGLTEISDFAACKLEENCGGLMLDGLSTLALQQLPTTATDFVLVHFAGYRISHLEYCDKILTCIAFQEIDLLVDSSRERFYHVLLVIPHRVLLPRQGRQERVFRISVAPIGASRGVRILNLGLAPNGTRFHIVDLTLRVRQAKKRGDCIRHSESDGYFSRKSSGIGLAPTATSCRHCRG